MKIDRLANAVRSTVFAGVLSLCRLAATFALRTALLYSLGVKYLGLNGLFASILQVLSIADLGVESAIAFSLYRPVAENDKGMICALLALYRKCYVEVGLFILIAGLCTLPLLPRLIQGGSPLDVNVYLAFSIYLLSAAASYLTGGYRKCLLKAHMRGDILSSIALAVLLSVTVLQLAAVCIFHNYYLYLILLVASAAMENGSAAMVTKTIYPTYRPYGALPRKYLIQFKQQIRDLFTAKISTVILNSADAVVISAFLGLEVLAGYQNYYYILTAVAALLEVVFNSTIAGIGNSLLTESKQKNFGDLKMLTFAVCWVSSWCACCFLCLYQPFIRIWVGEEYLLPFGMVILFACYFVAIELNRVINVYKDAAGMWHRDRFRPLTAALLNLVLNLLTVKTLGLYGVMLSSVVAVLGVEVPWLLRTLFSQMFPREYLRGYVRSLFHYVLGTLLVCVLSYMVCRYISCGGWLEIFGRAAVCLVVPNLAFLVIYHRKEEFRNWIEILKMVLSKRHPFHKE